MATGVHRLESPTDADLALALKLTKRYGDSGDDLPSLIVMAMGHHRKAQIKLLLSMSLRLSGSIDVAAVK